MADTDVYLCQDCAKDIKYLKHEMQYLIHPELA
eukprot:CAMPEP_0205801286 /NCGR_PEP_ID=MMETSP0205-20121125/3224_1 /ASSEMBLY_ACC=CAM_ASM_000278 /TAXON_ID=36767 /ORGANISM="Euplotes focardii, Strain TN1" /LENGTH=32 /DNA_ID= /DNA_START= /DNA_END= /DNA_ORIENTATION=